MEQEFDCSNQVAVLQLQPEETEKVRALADRLTAVSDSDPDYFVAARLLSDELPRSLRAELARFRTTNDSAALRISGLPVDEATLGPTPARYGDPVLDEQCVRVESALVLIGSAMGDPFSFLSQQRGKLVLDVYPVKGHETDQLGSSSDIELEWHNEDAFHEHRADWIMLACLRNEDAVATTIATADDLPLPGPQLSRLYEPEFAILPDESHKESFNVATTGVLDGGAQGASFAHIDELVTEPPRQPILSGDPARPYVRLDPAFMREDHLSEELLAIQRAAIDAISARLTDVALTSGDLLIIDNRRAVHGRRSFTARYDGTDRWLRRINVTSDIGRTAGRHGGEHRRAVR